MLRAFISRNGVQNSVQFSRKTQFFSSAAVEKVTVPKTAETEAPKEKSKAQQFREINPDMKLLNHLDSIRLGFLAKRSNRKAVARKIDNKQIDMQSMKVGDSYSKNTPFPFKAKGKLIHHAFTSDLIPHKFDGSSSYFQTFLSIVISFLPLLSPGNPPEVAVIGRSNVGKSTLINALIGFDSSFIQKAAMSERPGIYCSC
jgi:ribosome biogenesis GTPase A